jgi:alkanesulfonate monooxygenase SsuD/methylene tetrahydromethanopterin reductase-like flavin-dependent oxidoreductase (luciferase family)
MDFGLHGFPARAAGVSRKDHWQAVLDRLPPEFTTIWISDHLDGDSVEAWTLATFMAARYPSFRFGHLVLSQSYRNPALLAKMAATLQDLSEGRYILGLGAGWLEEDYRTFGYEFPPPGTRVAQLEEAIEVIRLLWAEPAATYHGTYYSIENAVLGPRPAVPIPILVGTNGPRALRVVARLADMWNWDGPWEQSLRQPYEILAWHCAEIGRPIQEIAVTAEAIVELPDDPAAWAASKPTGYWTTYPMGPTAPDVVRELRILADHGVQHVQVNVDDMPALDRFIAEVLPALRRELDPPR